MILFCASCGVEQLFDVLVLARCPACLAITIWTSAPLVTVERPLPLTRDDADFLRVQKIKP